MEITSLSVSELVMRAIADMGYTYLTPIQELAIPKMMEGRDVIGQAQTGTGKTAAFGIPLIDALDENERGVQALVLCPTRELAVQTAGELAKIAKYKNRLITLPVYGGQPIERQLRGLRAGAQIVVGTPGRVMDHMNRGSLSLENVKYAVLDEADEMLDMGFRDDIEAILSQTPEERQTALFSATMPFQIMSLAQKYLKNPEYLRIENKGMTVDAIYQSYIPVRAFHKTELLARLLVRDDISRALVFTNTKLSVEEIVTRLQSRGFQAAGLHGDMRQIERDAIMARFRQGMVGILVATDVAARGLDIDNVEAVFNYDVPMDVEYYVHRVGRTGRAGREGRAYTFTVGRETARMWEYRRITKATILCEQPPSGEDVRAAQQRRMVEEAAARAQTDFSEETVATAQELIERAGAEKAVSALLTLLSERNGNKVDPALDISIPEPPPRPAAPKFPDRRTNPGARPFTPARRGPYGRPVNPEANGGAETQWKPRPKRAEDITRHANERAPYPRRDKGFSAPSRKGRGEVRGSGPKKEN